MNYYCDICDKTIKQKSKNSHFKTKIHSKMQSYVREYHFIGDVLWQDFDYIICKYVNTNRTKFPIFISLIKCNLYDKNIIYRFDRTRGKKLLFAFGNKGFNYLYPVCKKVHNYINKQARIMNEELYPETIIKNLSITFYSYYFIMTTRHRLEQPRRILE